MTIQKPTHIKIDQVFEVSLHMLKHWHSERMITDSSLNKLLDLTRTAAKDLEDESFALEKYPRSLDRFPFEVGPMHRDSDELGKNIDGIEDLSDIIRKQQSQVRRQHGKFRIRQLLSLTNKGLSSFARADLLPSYNSGA